MHFGISLLQFFPGRVGGAGEYIERLIPELVRILEDGDQLTLFGNPTNLEPFQGLTHPKLNRVIIPWSRRFIQGLRFADLILPGSPSQLFSKAITDLRMDAVLFPQQSIFPHGIPGSKVVTVMDFLHERCPQFVGMGQRWLRRQKERQLVRECSATISISKATEYDLLRLHPLVKTRSFVVYLAGRSAEVPSTPNLVPAGSPYFYYPAAAFPHKNHGRLISAFMRFRKQYPETPVRLVLSGQQTARLQRLVQDASPDVLHLGFVSRAQVAAIYLDCRAVIIPSLFEGFGMPVIEGLGFGKPVYCSNLEVFRELAGDLVNYFDATSEQVLVSTFREMAEKSPLPPDPVRVSELLRSLTWERCARETYAILRRQVALGDDA